MVEERLSPSQLIIVFAGSFLFFFCPMFLEGQEYITDIGDSNSTRSQTSYNEEELTFARWDYSLEKQIPGHGPELPAEDNPWHWQWLPNGVLYRAYFASNRESRLAVHLIHEDKQDKNFWDPVLGGRFPLLRYGDESKLYPQGFQVDAEAAALARLTLDEDRDMTSTDYRFGLPLTWRKGHWETKLGYYHISSHMGDEWIVKHYQETGEVYRLNYVRDCIMYGIAYRPDANWRFYVGGDYAFWTSSGAEPWQFELGVEYSPILLPGIHGSPFSAVHFKWNEECDWETYFSFEFGWQWKTTYQHTMRTGLYYMSGCADQYQRYNRHETQVGYGLWFDF